MAAGFKTATVNASDVPSTQTNFPVYVDLSRLGITTLAEAESVRVYADSGKTTEWAREIVSATEMHVKIPSLTSTTSIYVDWDGSSADYAATDTYGRNAVWSSVYSAVFHFKEGSGTTAENSTGGTDATLSGAGLWNTDAPFGVAIGLLADGTNYVDSNISGTLVNYTLSFWGYINDPVGTQNAQMFSGSQLPSATRLLFNYYDDGNLLAQRDGYREYRNGTQAAVFRTGILDAWHHRAQTSVKGTTGGLIAYQNGVSVGTANTANADLVLSTNDIAILGNNNNGTVTKTVNPYRVSEWRFATSVLSADWLLTEYNNQSDEAGFWGTWSDAGGGAAPTPLLSLMGVGS